MALYTFTVPLQLHTTYSSSICVLVCSVIYSRVLQVSLSLHSTYSACRNLWDACPSYMHTHCLHHFHAYSLFALQLPLYNLHFCALCKCCLLSKPPTSHLRSAHTVMLCHSFHLCSLPSPPQTHTMYTYMHVFDQIVSIQVSTCSHPYHCSNQRILKASKSSLFFKWT